MNIQLCTVGGERGDMVIFTDWCLFPVIPRNTCGLPMDDEDTGLEAVASPMAGYLGKVSTILASSPVVTCAKLNYI